MEQLDTAPEPAWSQSAWAAVEARDRAADGRFVFAVKTTRIYCRPGCPARRPRRDHVEFFADGAAARDAGYRACLRCKPDDAARDRVAVTHGLAMIEGSEARLTLDALAAAVGYTPHHFQRLFKRATGVSPAAYARALQIRRATDALTQEQSVTDAIYEAGYSGPGRFYESAGERLGMAPGVWVKGGAGVTIRWTVTDTSLGPLLIAATDKGLCRVSFDEDAGALEQRFPNAQLVEGGDMLATLAARVAAEVETPGRDTDLPIHVRGTAFQEAVWQALRRIPAGETRSYAQLAAAIGKPAAVRAVGSACGANHVAVLIPCHRVQRGDGSMGGYAYGVERKRALRKREGVDE